jgi:diguanylate cyclase (GGDEF)-like protein
VARTLADTFRRPGDFVARYGGEEFVAVLPATGERGAAALAERMRERVESLGIPHRSSAISPSVTISIGTATTIPGPGMKPEELVQVADAALYRAKRQGRNRVEVSPTAAAPKPGTPATS